MERRIKTGLRMVPVVIFVLFFYVFLHASGHTIVALASGSKITEFDLFSTRPHMNYKGGNYTLFSTLWLHANGSLLPLFVSYIVAITYKKEIQNFFYRAFCFLFCTINTCSFLVWAVVPLLYMNGYMDAGEDAFKFTKIFFMYQDPRIISVFALLLTGLGALLIFWKEIPRHFFQHVRGLPKKENAT